jgi:hypothetical protein
VPLSKTPSQRPLKTIEPHECRAVLTNDTDAISQTFFQLSSMLNEPHVAERVCIIGLQFQHFLI